MKNHLLIAAALAVSGGAHAASAPGPVSSTISGVTVYTDRAVVTRTASVTLAPGTQDVVFDNLPPTLQDQTLQVSGRGTAAVSILDTTSRQTFVENTPNERVRALEEDIKGVQRQVRLLDDRAAVVAEQRDFVKRAMVAATTAPAPAPGTAVAPRPSLEEWRQVQAYAQESLARYATEIQDIDRQKEELALRITALQRQLADLRPAGARAQKTVTVRVDASSGGAYQLSVSYTVPGAFWSASYDARLRSATRTIELSYFGVVRQNTGEDWNNVALTLSTARPSIGGAVPELPTWVVGVPEAVVRLQAPEMASGAILGARGGAAAGRGGGGGGGRGGAAAPGGGAPEADAVFARATVDVGLSSATFKIASPATIPSNNTSQKVAITGTNLTPTLVYNVTPKLREAAFLVASTVNSTEFPLLAGPMNAFLDDFFVATSPLKMVMPGEKFDLALGVDDGIAVKRRLVNRFNENTGLTNAKRKVTYEYLVTLTNNKKSQEKIMLREPVPVSRHELVVVQMITPRENEISTEERPREIKREPNGNLLWELSLNPGEKREVTLKFSVEHPAEMAVSGVE